MGPHFAPSPAAAAPNCPPQYQELCKQFLKALADNDNDLDDYQWDGTFLTVGGNFASYSLINHSLTDHSNGHIDVTGHEQMGWNSFLPHFWNQVVAASQGGQRVYIHFMNGFSGYTDVGVSNTASLAPPTPIVTPQAVPPPILQSQSASVPIKAPDQIVSSVPSQVTSGYRPYNVPTPAQQLTPTPVPASQANLTNSLPKNQPKSISVTHSLKARSGQKIDKLNVNQHFVTKSAGSLIESEERAYLFDSNNNVWSCKVSGLGARRMPSSEGNHQMQGHVETLQFRSTHLAHIPGNHPMHPGCLISVQQ